MHLYLYAYVHVHVYILGSSTPALHMKHGNHEASYYVYMAVYPHTSSSMAATPSTGVIIRSLSTLNKSRHTIFTWIGKAGIPRGRVDRPSLVPPKADRAATRVRRHGVSYIYLCSTVASHLETSEYIAEHRSDDIRLSDVDAAPSVRRHSLS